MTNVTQTTATTPKTAISNTKKFAILTALFITPVTASLAILSMPQAYANPAAIAAGFEVIKEVSNAISPGSRSNILEVDNNTNVPLNVVATNHAHGGFGLTPQGKVAPR